MSEIPNFFNFRQHSPNFGCFPDVPFQLICSRLKRVATGIDSTRYRTNFLQKFFPTSFVKCLVLHKLPAKSLSIINAVRLLNKVFLHPLL